jgi:hypothetical protein
LDKGKEGIWEVCSWHLVTSFPSVFRSEDEEGMIEVQRGDRWWIDDTLVADTASTYTY